MNKNPIRLQISLSSSNIFNDIYSLISPIRPDWNSSNTRLEIFTEGITNSIFGLFDNRTDVDHSNGLIMKLFGANTDLFIDRQSEYDAMVKLSKDGVLSQHVLIQFANGVIYEYASGRACSREDVRKDHIAIKLPQFHSVSMEKSEKPYIIYNDKTDQISFIDFEYTHLNYYLFDIANHFVEYAGVDNADFNLYPTRDEQKRWLKIYFQTRQMDEPIVNDELCHLIDQFSALPHLLWGLWALVQSRLSQIDFDYVNYAKQRLDGYQKLGTILFQSIENEI